MVCFLLGSITRGYKGFTESIQTGSYTVYQAYLIIQLTILFKKQHYLLLIVWLGYKCVRGINTLRKREEK